MLVETIFGNHVNRNNVDGNHEIGISVGWSHEIEKGAFENVVSEKVLLMVDVEFEGDSLLISI